MTAKHVRSANEKLISPVRSTRAARSAEILSISRAVLDAEFSGETVVDRIVLGKALFNEELFFEAWEEPAPIIALIEAWLALAPPLSVTEAWARARGLMSTWARCVLDNECAAAFQRPNEAEQMAAAS